MPRRATDTGVLAALREQQSRLAASPARQASLDALGVGRCQLVATGQQVGLFLGPLYTFYKAATAVRFAQQISAASGERCAPLFWMATEDHDFAEVDHCYTVDPGEALPRRITVQGPCAGDAGRVPLAQRVLGPTIERCLEELAESLEGLPHGDETMALFAGAYRPERTFGRAFAEVLGQLFADEGLLILDPRDRRVAAAAAPFLRACLSEAEPIATALRQRVDELRRDGERERSTVHVREGAPLFFYQPRGAEGPRFRLELTAPGRYQLVGDAEATQLTAQTLEQALARDPLCFSSSALLRPVLQDALLPVTHTVGGPSEVDYLAQLPPLYLALDVRASEVVRRSGFRLLDAPLRQALEQLSLSAARACEASDDELEAHLARLTAMRNGDRVTPQTLERELLEGLEARLERLGAELRAASKDGASIEPALQSGIDKTRDSVQRSVGKLVGRYRRSLAADDAVSRSRLARARAALLPSGAPQERVLSLPYFLARYGAAQFRQRVLAAIDDPRAGQTLDLAL